ncbi:MAG: NUDIX hydrolase [Cyclobacteriaceae bacterium]|nr:NUDIX hydrolase [Cyclobacteriaceae bacterium]
MAQTRAWLIRFFSAYQSPYHEEQEFVPRFLTLLQDITCFERTHLPGHITGSAWIVNPERNAVLLVHHAKLNRWLQPGGHADGEEDVLNVALREAEEETGIQQFRVLSEIPFDVDVHPIPERKDFPAHDHYDVRFLLEAERADNIIVSEESHDVRWIALNKLEHYTNEQSVLRMKEKLLRAD